VFSASLDILIDDLVTMIAVWEGENMNAGYSAIPPFAMFPVYRAASLTARRIQADTDPETNLWRLRDFRNFLQIMERRWLVAGMNLY
jgi:hypothetical protein